MNSQALVDGLISGSMVGLGAIGVTLTYSILRFANFAHGEFVAWGAYFALAVSGALGYLSAGLLTPIEPFSFGWSLPIAAVAGAALTACLALLVDKLLFGPLRARRSAVIILMMASFGAALTLRNLLEFVFTSQPAYYTNALQIALPLGGGLRATPDQLLVLGFAAVLVVAIHLMLTRTAIGRSMRAVSENQQLSGVVGIDVRQVIRMVWILGAGLACFSGVMAGLLVQIRPQMGLDLLLPLFAAAILGGIGSVPGAMIAGLIVGLSEALTVQLIGAEWRAAVAFVILVAILVARPQGLFGEVGMTADLLSYGAFFMTMALTYAIICLGLNVQWGQTGLFNVGVSGFVAIGAYVSALLTTPDAADRFGGFGMPIFVGWLGGAAAAGLVTLLVGALTIKLRADYLAIATFGVAVVVQLALLNLEPVTGGPFGIGFIPRPFAETAANPGMFSALNFCVLAAVVAVLYVGLERLLRSPWGRVLRAIREDETAAVALGKSAVRFRLQAFAIGGAIMGLAGAAQAHFIGFIAPDNYAPTLTFQVWAMLIVGGSGNNRGAIVGSVIVWGLWAVSASVVSAFFPADQQARAASLQIVLIGVALCAILLLRPRGILGEVKTVSRHVLLPSAIAGGGAVQPATNETMNVDRP